MQLRILVRTINSLKTDLEFKIFTLGIFFLASAPSVSFLLLLFPTISGLRKNYKDLKKDKLNYLLLSAAFIMIAKSIITSYLGSDDIKDWESSLNWAGLGNWIPHFLIYCGSQRFVQSSDQRSLIAKSLILGTVPVIFSCFSQYFLGWYGPYKLLNGFVVWYQRSRADLNQPITGLFNNPNYAGAWLAMIWPFLLSYLSQKRKNSPKFEFITVFALSILFVAAISLINSRGAFLGALASIPLVFGQGVIFWFLPIVSLTFLSIFICTLPTAPENIKSIICFLIPNNILTNFNELTFRIENLPRVIIWGKAFNLIAQKPFFGWGAATFPILYFSQYGDWKGHPHNLFLELSISYGLVTSLLIFTFIAILLIKTFKKIYVEKISGNYFERAWYTSIVVFLILHSFDIVYFDARISLLLWILLAGLKGVLNQTKNLESIKKQ